MKRVESLLRQHIGLDAASIGSSLIERTVRLRMKALGVKKVEDYKRLLETLRGEWDELVEAVVVTETWFFRDREPFSAFAQLAQNECLRKSAESGGLLRVLSVPCSSGEEPYSLAMALLDAGVPKEHFAIEAVDISARALERAGRAVYGKNSFRGKDLGFRNRYFQQTKQGYVLHPTVRASVRFQQGNLLSDDFPADHAFYDFVFCRNLLIYFDHATQVKVLEKVHHMLAPSGFLFVGPAELPLVMNWGFVSANVPMAFACRKGAHAPPRRALHARQSPPEMLLALPPLTQTLPDHGGSDRTPAHSAPPESGTDLNAARRLADAGKLREAAAICEAHLSEHGPTAQAYYLLGLVHDANGDPLAVEFYRKALYLEPNHYETLLQMALLSQKNGDTVQARAFRRRAERAKANAEVEP